MSTFCIAIGCVWRGKGLFGGSVGLGRCRAWHRKRGVMLGRITRKEIAKTERQAAQSGRASNGGHCDKKSVMMESRPVGSKVAGSWPNDANPKWQLRLRRREFLTRLFVRLFQVVWFQPRHIPSNTPIVTNTRVVFIVAAIDSTIFLPGVRINIPSPTMADYHYGGSEEENVELRKLEVDLV